MKRTMRWALPAGLFAAVMAAGVARAETEFNVERVDVVDLKTVYAEVRPIDTVPGRARIGGTVATLSVDEGQAVKAGEVIAMVGDPKLALTLDSLAAQIKVAEAEYDNAETQLKRGRTLIQRGIISQASLDELETAAEVATRKLDSAKAERSVVEQQLAEGAVEAPTDGRVLTVPVTTGAVIMAGETVATIAAEGYILRLEVPERHARFMAVGDKIFVARRQLGADEAAPATVTGTIKQVYPELQNGRVVADATVEDLGDYFVGERALVRVSAGHRSTYAIPESFVKTRYGIDFVRLKRPDGEIVDVVVQLGRRFRKDDKTFIEVLTGVADGDTLVMS